MLPLGPSVACVQLTSTYTILFVQESTSSEEINQLKENNSKQAQELQALRNETECLKEELNKTVEELRKSKEDVEIYSAQQQSVSENYLFYVLLWR